MGGMWAWVLAAGVVAGGVLALAGGARAETAAATQFAGPGVPSNWYEKQPGWAEPVNGLRVGLTGSGWMAPGWGLQVQMGFWNVTGGMLAFVADDEETHEWEVRDASGKLVEASNVPGPASGMQPQDRWWRFISGQSSPGLIVGRDGESRDGTLRIGRFVWKLPVGSYTLGGTFSGPSKVAGRPPMTDKSGVWTGKVTLVPLAFTVYGKVDEKTLQAEAATVRAVAAVARLDEWTMDLQLAHLVQPGMPTADVEEVLPGMAGGQGSMTMDGNFLLAEYSVSPHLKVRYQGLGRLGEKGGFILCRYPEIVPR